MRICQYFLSNTPRALTGADRIGDGAANGVPVSASTETSRLGKNYRYVSWVTVGRLSIAENYPCRYPRRQVFKMIDHCLSALATAWFITFVATTGLVTALAAESVWDSQVYFQALQDVLTTDPL